MDLQREGPRRFYGLLPGTPVFQFQLCISFGNSAEMPDVASGTSYGPGVLNRRLRHQLEDGLAVFCWDPVVSRGASLGERDLEFIIQSHFDFRAVRVLIVLHG